MKKIFVSMLAVLTVLFATAQKDIINDPNAEVRIISGSFSSIKISGGIDLFLSAGNEEAVAVSASDNKFKEAIRTEVVNGQLKIYYDGDKGWNNWKNRQLRVYVSFKDLQSVEAAGASDVQVSGVISVPSLYLNLSGASDFKGAVAVNDLKLSLSGASDVTIKGTATKVDIESSGASDVKGYELTAEYCTAKASGASDIHITVTKELSAHASGASDIKYKGEAVIKEQHTGGASSVEKKS
jgi:Putative auto-transporter adhesin, head GIN domain